MFPPNLSKLTPIMRKHRYDMHPHCTRIAHALRMHMASTVRERCEGLLCVAALCMGLACICSQLLLFAMVVHHYLYAGAQ